MRSPNGLYLTGRSNAQRNMHCTKNLATISYSHAAAWVESGQPMPCYTAQAARGCALHACMHEAAGYKAEMLSFLQSKNTSRRRDCEGAKIRRQMHIVAYHCISRSPKRISKCFSCTLTCLNGSELGHGLGSFGHGVLGQLSGEDQADGRLDLARGHSRLLVV